MRFTIILGIILISVICCSCDKKCNYRDISISTTAKDLSVRIGDSITFDVILSCSKGGKIALFKEPLSNMFVITDSGFKSKCKNDFSNYKLYPAPVTYNSTAKIEQDINGIHMLFVDSGCKIMIHKGKNNLRIYYHPPKKSLGWTDSDEGYPYTDLDLNISE